MEHKSCDQCRYWQRTRVGANWGFCKQINLDFAGKTAFIYTFGADFVRHPELRIELQTRDTHYCKHFEKTVLEKSIDHALNRIQEVTEEAINKAKGE